VHADILLSNELFSNKKNDSDEGNGILDIFDLYNFTVKEDEPLEKEVAIDPEMLGKVFENLLEVKDRKSKGTYYTPREIVHYMCQQSLINYLDTAINTGDVPLVATRPPQGKLFGKPDPEQGTLKAPAYRAIVPREDIEAFVRMGDLTIEHDARVEGAGRETRDYSYKLPESIRQNASLIDEKLGNVRICDPAVGSGAFLVGMMTEIVRARNVLTTYLLGEEVRSKYIFKRHAIQNCLYGVDIDPSAVEIAKLRLWLSLVVDEEDIRQIQPLPNLDYKIVCGNSLLGVEKTLFNLDLFEKLEGLELLHFDETNVKKKHEHKKQIDHLIRQITDNNENFDFKVYFSKVFREKGGFDVVIANPPYMGEKGHKEIFRQIKQGTLKEYYQGKMDIFYFFFHLSIDLGNTNSQIAFITTNYYPTATGASKLRQDFKKRTIIRKLVNFNELKIFESAQGQHNMLAILSNGHDDNAMATTCITKRKGDAIPQTLQSIISWQDDQTSYYQVLQKDLYEGDECYIRPSVDSENSNDLLQSILEKVKQQGKVLGEFCNVNQGILSGADKVTQKHIRNFRIKADIGDGIFVLDNEEIDYLEISYSEKSILKPWFKNSDIGRWWTNTRCSEYLIYADKRLKNLEHNSLKKHLLKFKDILDHSTDNSPYLHRPRDIDFCGPKIIAPQRSPRNTFGYNEIPWYAASDVFFITEKDNSIFLKYILALINSSPYYLWLYHRGKRKGEMLELIATPLSEIPIKKISKIDQKPFISIVDKILAVTKDEDYPYNPDKQAQVKEYEHQIDQMVYELYGLTPEEIAVVESSHK
jgi:adenine-specific DNA-methyltransferase